MERDEKTGKSLSRIKVEAFIQHIFEECEQEGFTQIEVLMLTEYIKREYEKLMIHQQTNTKFTSTV